MDYNYLSQSDINVFWLVGTKSTVIQTRITIAEVECNSVFQNRLSLFPGRCVCVWGL